MPQTTKADPDRLRDGFRGLMAGFPTGVTVVTAAPAEDRPQGMTCSSLCSVTLEPPTLLVCLHTVSRTLAAVLESGSFAVNLLAHDAQPTADLFASGTPDRFERVRWTLDRHAGGPHLVLGAHAVADCAVTGTQQIGDHVVVLGEVTRVVRREGPRPLLYGLRRYSAWPAPADARTAAGSPQ